MLIEPKIKPRYSLALVKKISHQIILFCKKTEQFQNKFHSRQIIKLLNNVLILT